MPHWSMAPSLTFAHYAPVAFENLIPFVFASQIVHASRRSFLPGVNISHVGMAETIYRNGSACKNRKRNSTAAGSTAATPTRDLCAQYVLREIRHKPVGQPCAVILVIRHGVRIPFCAKSKQARTLTLKILPQAGEGIHDLDIRAIACARSMMINAYDDVVFAYLSAFSAISQ